MGQRPLTATNNLLLFHTSGQPKIMQNKAVSYDFITTPAQVEVLAGELAGTKVAGVDLEADSMHHFSEKICLIQIYYNDKNVLIDPLTLDNLDALKPFFADAAIPKIFHGADYDVRSLYRDFGIEINNLFDTEIASRFLGYNESGLATALHREFGLMVDKRFQKKDWSIRPLPKDMLDYAASDTLYLIPLARILRDRLRSLGRLEWVEEESLLISQVRPAENNGEPLFLNFKGAGRLKGNCLTVLEALLHLRIQFAEKKDRAPFMIMGNQAILSLATEQPHSLEDLKAGRILSARQYDMYGKDIIKTIRQACNIPKAQWFKYPYTKQKRMTEEELQIVENIKAMRDKKAEILEMAPSLLLTKAQLNLLAQKHPRTLEDLERIDSIRKWQVNYLGVDILKTLALDDEANALSC